MIIVTNCTTLGRIFGKLTRLDAKLEEGTRTGIYRPITADPETVERRGREN